MTTKAPELAYLVLRCEDLERARGFYEAAGLSFVAERHGDSALHYSATLGATVLELYPRRDAPTSGVRIGLRVRSTDAIADALRANGGDIIHAAAEELVARDPDGHTIHFTLV